MDNRDTCGCAFLIGAVIIACLITWGMTNEYTQKATDNWWKSEIARRGHAEYYFDANFEKQWRWKEQAE